MILYNMDSMMNYITIYIHIHTHIIYKIQHDSWERIYYLYSRSWRRASGLQISVRPRLSLRGAQQSPELENSSSLTTWICWAPRNKLTESLWTSGSRAGAKDRYVTHLHESCTEMPTLIEESRFYEYANSITLNIPPPLSLHTGTRLALVFYDSVTLALHSTSLLLNQSHYRRTFFFFFTLWLFCSHKVNLIIIFLKCFFFTL